MMRLEPDFGQIRSSAIFFIFLFFFLFRELQLQSGVHWIN